MVRNLCTSVTPAKTTAPATTPTPAFATIGKVHCTAAPAPAAAEPVAAAPAAAAGITEEKIALLQKLTELQKAGVLTDDEFAAEKAKILNG